MPFHRRLPLSVRTSPGTQRGSSSGVISSASRATGEPLSFTASARQATSDGRLKSGRTAVWGTSCRDLVRWVPFARDLCASQSRFSLAAQYFFRWQCILGRKVAHHTCRMERCGSDVPSRRLSQASEGSSVGPHARRPWGWRVGETTRDQLEDEQGQSWLEAEDGCSDPEVESMFGPPRDWRRAAAGLRTEARRSSFPRKSLRRSLAATVSGHADIGSEPHSC